MSNLIDSVRTYLIGCPLLNDGRVNVDYIGEEMCYSVDPLPCDPIIKRYVDPDGCHPDENGYKKYYVRPIIKMFESILPID